MIANAKFANKGCNYDKYVFVSVLCSIGCLYSNTVYIQHDATLHSLFYLETALYIWGGTSTHHQERKQLYLQHLVFVTLLLLSVAIVRHPQHTQTSSNSSTIATDSRNGVTNTRCCRYSCLRS